MTYRDSDALCLPVRAPQHAAPIGVPGRRSTAGPRSGFGRLRRLARQVLQLFIAAVAWATGLGLVISSIVLVATITAPRRPAPPLKVSRLNDSSAVGNPLSFSTVPGSGVSNSIHGRSDGAAALGRYRVIAAFSGRGNRTTEHFKVSSRRAWQLRWTYRCSPHGAGQFTLLRGDMAADEATVHTSVEEYAHSAHGSAWLKSTGTRHYLMVISACSWRIKVVQAR